MTLVRPAADKRTAAQISFDDIGTPLRDVTFVVVDLETTGAVSATARITEIAAVRVRSGELLEEFQTLVDPGTAIPPFITVLTGITDAHVAGAPPVAQVLPEFLRFIDGSVLVAHNAPFDVGFLESACTGTGHEWPGPVVVDTAALARRLIGRDEAPDCRLHTLARLFQTGTTPTHRALDDARATVDVLHALLERLAGQGVTSLEDLTTFCSRVPRSISGKRHLAQRVPPEPGAYVFTGPDDEVLYVGRGTDLHARVQSYFTAPVTRRWAAEMLLAAEDVVPHVCAGPLEAEVRELRLVAEHRPRFNRGHPVLRTPAWLTLTTGPLPRLSVVHAPCHGDVPCLGPFPSAEVAGWALDALRDALPSGEGAAGAGVEMAATWGALVHDPAGLAEVLLAWVAPASDRPRDDETSSHPDRLATVVRSVARIQHLAAFTALPQVAAARPLGRAGAELAVIRRGRLAVAESVDAQTRPEDVLERHVCTAPPAGPGPTSPAEVFEARRILRWLEHPDTRLLEVGGRWCCPVRGEPGLWARLDRVDDADAACSRPAPHRGS